MELVCWALDSEHGALINAESRGVGGRNGREMSQQRTTKIPQRLADVVSGIPLPSSAGCSRGYGC